MAKEPPSAKRAGRADPSGAPLGRLKKMSIIASLAAAIHEAGARNVLASTALTVAAPVTATAFVYEVSTLRTAQLSHEAEDRAQFAVRLAAEANAANNHDATTPVVLQSAQSSDMSSKLDAMLQSRAVMLDTFGDDPSAVAPVYALIIKQMIKDDDDVFASLQDKQGMAEPAAAKIVEKTARLHDMHQKLSRLAGVKA